MIGLRRDIVDCDIFKSLLLFEILVWNLYIVYIQFCLLEKNRLITIKSSSW